MTHMSAYEPLPFFPMASYERDFYTEQKKRKNRKDTRYKGVLDLIPTKYRFSKHDKTDLDTILTRSSKTTVYQIQKRKATEQDPTDEKVQQLLLLSSNRIKPEIASKLLHRANKKRCIQQEEKPKEPEKTAFTEEDFKKFEQEYIQ